MAKAARSHHCHAAFQYARVLSHPEECPHAVDVLGIFRVCQPRPDTFSVRCRDTKGLRPEYRMGSTMSILWIATLLLLATLVTTATAPDPHSRTLPARTW